MPELDKLDALWEQASVESVDFVEKHLGEALVFSDESKFFDFLKQKMYEPRNGRLFVRFMAQVKDNALNDFFEEWPYNEREQLICKKWFRSLVDASKSNNSLKVPDSSGTPPTDTYYGDNFSEQFPVSEIASARLIHIDGGTSELVRNLLEKSEKQLMPGVLILFGELIDYPNWRNGQYRAWTEIAKNHGIKFRYLGFCDHQALVEITGRDAPSTEDAEA